MARRLSIGEPGWKLWLLWQNCPKAPWSGWHPATENCWPWSFHPPITSLGCIVDSCMIAASYETSQAQKALLLMPRTGRGASTSSEEFQAQLSPPSDPEFHAAYLAQDRDILGDHWMLDLWWWWWWLDKNVWVDSESAVNAFICLTRLLTLALFSPTFHRFVSALLILRGVVVVSITSVNMWAVMPGRLVLCDLGDPGWGDPRFQHSAVLLCSHLGMARWCWLLFRWFVCRCCVCFAMPVPEMTVFVELGILLFFGTEICWSIVFPFSAALSSRGYPTLAALTASLMTTELCSLSSRGSLTLASSTRRPEGSVGMALVLPALTDCRWWFESLLVHSGVSSATRRKATGADHKKTYIGIVNLVNSLMLRCQPRVSHVDNFSTTRRTRRIGFLWWVNYVGGFNMVRSSFRNWRFNRGVIVTSIVWVMRGFRCFMFLWIKCRRTAFHRDIFTLPLGVSVLGPSNVICILLLVYLSRQHFDITSRRMLCRTSRSS